MRHAWVMRLQSCRRESQKGGLPGTTHCHSLTSAEGEQGPHLYVQPANVHNNAGVDRDMAAVRSHLRCLGLPPLPVASGSQREKTFAMLSLRSLWGFT